MTRAPVDFDLMAQQFPNLNANLSPEEFESLRELSEGLMRRNIPDAHRAKLPQLGFIVERLGGWMLTDLGRLRLAKGS